MSALRRLLRDQRGGAGIMVAAAMPILIGMGALAVDVGSVQLETRRLQGIADAAAIAAASNPGNAQGAAEAVVAANWARPVTVRTTAGTYSADQTQAQANRFVAGGASPDAARVVLEAQSPTFLAAIFGQRSVTIARHATAARQRLAAFSIGSRLASLDGGILNAYLGALTGSSLSLSVADYQALASANVDLFSYLPLLKSSANLDAATFDDVLKSQVSTPQALSALAAALDAKGSTQAANAVRSLLNVSGGRSVALNALIDAGPFRNASSGGTGIASVDGLAFVTALLQLASPSRQVSLDLGAGVPGLASTRISLAIGEREQQSPWIAISAAGTPIVRTAQVRLYVRTRVEATGLDGLSGLAKINLPILVELASAEGKLNAIDCATPTTRSVTLDARTDIGSASLGTIDETRLADFSTALTPSEATLVQALLLLEVKGKSRISLGAAEPWKALRFSQDEIDRGVRKTVQSSTPVAGVATSLLTQADLRLSPVPLPLSPILRSVGGALNAAAPALDSLLMVTTGTLGVGLGEADLRVTGMRCGTAVLVA
ncbi:pilus assembly protein TadG-related protein [Sphingomonas sp. SUN019]|uniref:pilus assembly protein TadG-related protein n=1 Tax=Sphingomonas sp. SUN019 TaxID=2937788 RepID=UPI0021646C5C|nr:pilus assembly protein TadG-related protein [Sphingomonas sp. SUN019]UVO51838.1 pilus assembly protein TadG-related protein [Sphingomonas sp. SUN019]